MSWPAQLSRRFIIRSAASRRYNFRNGQAIRRRIPSSVPLLNYAFGVMNYLPGFWIGSLAVYAACYCGVIIGGIAWIGGSVARDAVRRAEVAASGSLL